MSAMVCGKRSFFEDNPSSPTSASPPVSKRLRCSSSTSPVRFSPFSYSPPALVEKLRAVFPGLDKKILEKALEECGNDLDSAIKSLHELCLGTGSTGKLSADNKGAATSNDETAPLDNSSAQGNLPRSGAEWVELFVNEMRNATSIDDARSRVMRVLESLEKFIGGHADPEAAESFQKENMALKEQIEILLRENTILKRAVAIQHERQTEYDDRNREVQQLKLLVSQYQEQLRTLEVNNYALTMHLRQSQESNSIPGRFHPDVF